MKSFFVLFLLLSVFIARQVFAQNLIRINEFLLEPTPQQVEIINTGTESADISGWSIDDNGGSTYYTIPQSSILYPNACLVFSGDLNLNKLSADTIRLFNNGNLIDSFSYKSSSGSGVSYLRLPDGIGNWTTKSASLGIFNESGLSCIITPTLTTTPTSISTQTPTPSLSTPQPTVESRDPVSPIPSGDIGTTITPISYQNIYISEVMVNPSLGEYEWVEFFNNNDFIVTLTDWFIDDVENAGSSPKLFSLDIAAKSHGVIDMSSSIFNNTGDSVRLLNFNKTRIDDFEYTSTTQGKTFGRISYDSDEFCFQEPSKGTVNNSCINQIPISNPTSKLTNKPTNLSYPSTTAVANRLVPSVSIYRYINTNNNVVSPVYPVNYGVNQLIREGEILGITTQSKNNKSLIHYLSFISFSYSLLTILSVFLKMKKRYEKSH